ncbi:MAG: hypothetical protein V1770_03750 [bacterium]
MNTPESNLFNIKIMKTLLHHIEESLESERPTCYIAAIVRGNKIISIC